MDMDTIYQPWIFCGWTKTVFMDMDMDLILFNPIQTQPIAILTHGPLILQLRRERGFRRGEVRLLAPWPAVRWVMLRLALPRPDCGIGKRQDGPVAARATRLRRAAARVAVALAGCKMGSMEDLRSRQSCCAEQDVSLADGKTRPSLIALPVSGAPKAVVDPLPSRRWHHSVCTQSGGCGRC